MKTTRELVGFGPGPKGALPIVDAILQADLLPPEAAYELTAAPRRYREPYTGITTDGTPVGNLFPLADTGVDAKAAVDAAHAYLGSLEPFRRTIAQLPMDSPDWRLWTNALPTWAPKGMRLERLAQPQRTRALGVIQASLSAEGYDTVRSAMRLNGALGELVEDYTDTLTEFAYWFTIFGDPSSGDPWGWQLMGHHVDVHCVFVGSQLVLAPIFVGAEPTFSASGRWAGTHVLDAETECALTLRRALSAGQEEHFLLGTSMRSADLPPELGGPFNGRHLSGAGQDNLVLPYEGIPAADLDEGQRQLLLDLIKVYLRRMPEVHAQLKFEQVAEYLDETRFAWRGGHGKTSAFYYRIHSPVLLVEYDNHPGIFLENPEPERFHVHTIVREPNGNDYGMSLLAQHYALQHDNSPT